MALNAPCPIGVLAGVIEHRMRRSRRYELALMRERPSVEKAVDHHARITAALRKGDLAGACALLKENLIHGREPILAWLREREARERGQGA